MSEISQASVELSTAAGSSAGEGGDDTYSGCFSGTETSSDIIDTVCDAISALKQVGSDSFLAPNHPSSQRQASSSSNLMARLDSLLSLLKQCRDELDQFASDPRLSAAQLAAFQASTALMRALASPTPVSHSSEDKVKHSDSLISTIVPEFARRAQRLFMVCSINVAECNATTFPLGHAESARTVVEASPPSSQLRKVEDNEDESTDGQYVKMEAASTPALPMAGLKLADSLTPNSSSMPASSKQAYEAANLNTAMNATTSHTNQSGIVAVQRMLSSVRSDGAQRTAGVGEGVSPIEIQFNSSRSINTIGTKGSRNWDGSTPFGGGKWALPENQNKSYSKSSNGGTMPSKEYMPSIKSSDDDDEEPSSPMDLIGKVDVDTPTLKQVFGRRMVRNDSPRNAQRTSSRTPLKSSHTPTSARSVNQIADSVSSPASVASLDDDLRTRSKWCQRHPRLHVDVPGGGHSTPPVASSAESLGEQWDRVADNGKAKQQEQVATQAIEHYASAERFFYGQQGSQDFSKAYLHYLFSARMGYPQAFNRVGMCCQHGLGTVQDTDSAKDWYFMACDHGVLDAFNNLGCMLAESHETASEAARLFHNAATKGNDDAQTNLGGLFEQGKGVNQSIQRARMWYQVAASQGNPKALNRLGLLHHRDGEDGLAARCFDVAARAGYLTAINNLGLLVKGMHLLCIPRISTIALCTGLCLANELLFSGSGPVPCMVCVYMHLWTFDFLWALFLIGRCYEEGRGVQQDFECAKQCYQEAVELGSDEGKVNLGNLLLEKGDANGALVFLEDAVQSGLQVALSSYAIALAKTGNKKQSTFVLQSGIDGGDFDCAVTALSCAGREKGEATEDYHLEINQDLEEAALQLAVEAAQEGHRESLAFLSQAVIDGKWQQLRATCIQALSEFAQDEASLTILQKLAEGQE